MIRFVLIAIFSLALCSGAYAEDYTKLFEVDLDEKLPSLKELQEKYSTNNKDYDRKYDYHWNIGNVFDEIFKVTIVSYGSSTKRVPNEEEENLLRLINVIPQEYWQYIGPYLHTVPGVPEKILNMPGIKETKNKFPTRIAKELEGIEDIEFLSPYLYFILMPEAWPSYKETSEKPKRVYVPPQSQTKYEPEFFDKLRKLVPEENYLPGKDVAMPLESRLRTIKPTKTSPLTTADVRAFANTISSVEEWGQTDYNILKIGEAGALLDAWERDNGRGLPIQSLKTVVNPCQRLVQKIKLAGLEYDFLSVIGKEGFDLNGWAYTCDKTIKAYRLLAANRNVLASVMAYKKSIYESGMELLDEHSAQQQYAIKQSVAEMYTAPMGDVVEVLREKENIRKEITAIQESLIDSPIIITY